MAELFYNMYSNGWNIFASYEDETRLLRGETSDSSTNSCFYLGFIEAYIEDGTVEAKPVPEEAVLDFVDKAYASLYNIEVNGVEQFETPVKVYKDDEVRLVIPSKNNSMCEPTNQCDYCEGTGAYHGLNYIEDPCKECGGTGNG